MRIQPKREVCAPSVKRWAILALRVLGGVLLLTGVALSSGHSHVGELTSSGHCAVCQIVGLDLDSSADVPAPAREGEVGEECVFTAPDIQASFPSLPGLFPRGPPPLA